MSHSIASMASSRGSGYGCSGLRRYPTDTVTRSAPSVNCLRTGSILSGCQRWFQRCRHDGHIVPLFRRPKTHSSWLPQIKPPPWKCMKTPRTGLPASGLITRHGIERPDSLDGISKLIAEGSFMGFRQPPSPANWFALLFSIPFCLSVRNLIPFRKVSPKLNYV